MSIYIEANSFYGKRSGVGRYALRTAQELCALRPDDQFVFFSFLRPGRQPIIDFDIPPNARLQFIRWFPGRVFSLLMRRGISLPLELFGLGRADVILFPNFIAWASLANKPRISVIHDIAFEFYPEYIQAKNLAYLKQQVPLSLKRSKAVVAVSEWTRQDVSKHYGTTLDKISVAYNAVDAGIFNPETVAQLPETRKRFNLPDCPYMLFVGNVEPRKNLEGLLQAYAASYSEHQLAFIIVGAKGWNDSGIDERLTELKDLPIYRTNFIDDADIAALYAGAAMFVYPSHYEGFGIPCVEAMACGCPVICSDNSSFPEVVGDAALMLDADDLGGIAAAITRLAHDSDLQKQLRTAGITQAKQFTWQASAAAISRVIDTVQ